MKSDDIVTVTGAAGGTGLAASELSLMNGNEVRFEWMIHDKTVCIVRGSDQKEYLTGFVKTHYPKCCVHIIDSEATPSFRDSLKSFVFVWIVVKEEGGSSLVFDTVGTDSLFCSQLLRSVRFGAHILCCEIEVFLWFRSVGNWFLWRFNPTNSCESSIGEECECIWSVFGRLFEELSFICWWSGYDGWIEFVESSLFVFIVFDKTTSSSSVSSVWFKWSKWSNEDE